MLTSTEKLELVPQRNYSESASVLKINDMHSTLFCSGDHQVFNLIRTMVDSL